MLDIFFMGLLPILMSSLEKCLFSPLPIFQLDCFFVIELHEVFAYFGDFFFFFFGSLGLHLRHMEVPRLGVELELQLLRPHL